MYKNVAILGASSSIAKAIMNQINIDYPDANIFGFSRKLFQNNNDKVKIFEINYDDELSIERAANLASQKGPLDLVFIANGILHTKTIKPEKSIRDFSVTHFEKVFKINSILPAMVAKYFIPKLNRESRAVFSVLSARVGSISDNKLGGWYAYRSSKAALNMIIKNLAIETNRSNKKAIIISLHPGTVDTPLSKPFQNSIETNKIFSPEISAIKLFNVIENLSYKDSGNFIAWDNKKISP